MRRLSQGTALIAALATTGSTAQAAEIFVNNPINVSQVWTANNTYNLQGQVYLTNNATLTIMPGTVVASDPGGSLAVTRGAQINVLGRRCDPVIMTSKADVATWTGGDPRTGVWREAANEWGNLTIMGRAYISENAIGANTPFPSPTNVGDMEGLTSGPATDRYGGGNDNDDSGTIRYLSIRYGGRVVALTNELNGLSLGGIGRGTDIHHVEIMNNVDDGIEVWGGTVNFKYLSIWNIGDDSFDIDQGWRGKAQFGLIVQGYSLDAPSGSGVGDNAIEHDGAEQSDYQPVTTAVIKNFTIIGQPAGGDHGTAWRDGARIQYHKCIFMDIGVRVVSFDNVDGDGGAGYGFNGTLTWPQVWTTPYNMVPAHANDFTTGTYAQNYPAQSSAFLAGIWDSVFFRNLNAAAYTEANARGVFNASNNNVLIPGFDPADAPIRVLERAAPVMKGGRTMVRVTKLDPRPMNEAAFSVVPHLPDSFFWPTNFRGAFPPVETPGKPDQNWLHGWTAADAFGFLCDPRGNTVQETRQ